uniref:Rab5-interacting protein n=1 Tax=Parastrongyloides trichosuri TaxID=131310 RepID=A0A0N4ZQW9_PARTI
MSINPEKPSILSSLNKALKPNSEWCSRDEILDVLYWGKQLLSIVIGMIWGVLPFTGITSIIAFTLASGVSSYLYVTRFQEYDDEELGGFFEIAREGISAAFATFMITWIVTYTLIHH